MPAFAAHYLFAEEMLPFLKELEAPASLREDAIFYGTQGPDFLFFHRILPTMPGRSLNKLGSRMHKADPALLFDAMLDYLREGRCDRNMVLPFCYGFLCHYALDRTAHPYIYATQAQIIRQEHIHYMPGVVHNRIEFNIDMLMLREKKGLDDARRFESRDTLSEDGALLMELGRLLSPVARRDTGDEAEPWQYEQALRDMRKLQATLTDRRGWKLPLIGTLELLLRPFVGPCFTTMMRHKHADGKWDYLNTAHAKWIYPAAPERTHTESFPELFERAKLDAARLCKAFRACLSEGARGDFTGHLSFLTGMPIDRTAARTP